MRTEIVERQLYTFGELSDQAKQTAIEGYARNLDDWDEHVIEYCRDVLIAAGVADPVIMYSGFYSQGDGACFSGTWYRDEVDLEAIDRLFQTYRGKDGPTDPSGFLLDISALPTGLSAQVRNHSRHSHHLSPTIEVEWLPGMGPGFVSKEIDDAVREALRDSMCWIYAVLEKEWDHSTSDQTVAEMSTANGWEYLEDGTLV